MTIYNVTELHVRIEKDGDHTEVNSVEHELTSSPWFREQYPYLHDAGVDSGVDCYDISGSEVENDDEDEANVLEVTIYRYFKD